MKYIILIVANCFVLSSCITDQSQDRESLNRELLERDRAWSKLVSEKGFQSAMEEHYAEEIISISSGKNPIIGKQELLNTMKEHPDTNNSFSWIPQKAEVSESGDLGYTWGRWKFTGINRQGEDTIFYGVYATVWKRQPDGKWRAVLDQSNNTPKP